MAKKFPLKLRPMNQNAEVRLRADWVKSILDDIHTPDDEIDAGKHLIAGIRPYIEGIVPAMHDAVWLERVATYIKMTDEGRPIPPTLKDQAVWLPLIKRLSKVNRDKDSWIAITDAEIDELWKRMTSTDFKVDTAHHTWAEFVLDFLKFSGKAFESMTNDPDLAALEAEMENGEE